MLARRLIVIGTSSGGIDALRTLVADLSPDLAAAICVVLHTSPDSPGVLPSILNRVSTLPVTNAENGMRIEQGNIYVAPPNRHLLIEPGSLVVSNGPRENRTRPAIDPLFRSAAQVYGPAVIGVLLTGELDDGTSGLWTINRMGGVTIVQSPADAEYPSMPRHAAERVDVDLCLPLTEIAPQLARLTARDIGAPVRPRPPSALDVEVSIAKGENAVDAGIEQIGEPSRFSCPECHGVLLRLKEAGLVRFRCHTGHAYSPASLSAAVRASVEDAIWNAVRTVEEAALLLQELAAHSEAQHGQPGGTGLRDQATEAHRNAEAMRQLVSAKPVQEPLKSAGS